MSHPASHRELLNWIDVRWAALLEAAATAGRAVLPDGWTPAQHLHHVESWERSLLALLDGKDRATAMGLTAAEWGTHDGEAINAAIAARSAELDLDAALASARATHDRLRARLAAMDDEASMRPYSSYQPDDPPFNSTPVVNWINGNTWGHYDDHLAAFARG